MLDWIKAVHVLAVISWMAGLLYLPRLLVYHSGVAVGTEASETFKIMERRLLKAITTPAMIISWGAGLWLATEVGWWRAGWFHGKVALTLMLSGLHGYLAWAVRHFAMDERPGDGRWWRIVNEAPTVLMIGIVVLVVVKPF
jgi:putative membrane protein